MADNITAYLIAGGGVACAVALMIWIVIRARRAAISKRRAGSFVIAASLFLGFGRMFERLPDHIEAIGDPGRQKRPERGASGGHGIGP